MFLTPGSRAQKNPILRLGAFALSLTAGQRLQARTTLDAAARPENWTITVFTSGSGTYTTKTNCKGILVRCVGAGGGGGGGGSGPSGGTGGTGGNTTFAGGSISLAANGGNGNGGGGFGSTGGGSASGGDINITGQQGWSSYGAGGTSSVIQGTPGGIGPFCAGGGSGGWPGQAGAVGTTNTGSGGGGGGASANGNGGAGGAAGGYCEKWLVSPISSYSYAVGGAGTAGGVGGGSNAGAGGAGGSGILIIYEFY